ncbi:glutamyl-tRNA reductase [Utexia brackfieldae]|uniref:glutamyl-tRNA reductase n=1 Tax=Utexia brackfieldae TaxID=3074108 RepID=UPI00370DAB5A
MSIAILGVNHKTAPLALREKMAFPPDKMESALYSLHQHPLITGCVILSTCNRTELYLSLEQHSDLHHVKSAVEKWLCLFHDIRFDDFRHSLYWYANDEAVVHLMRVACGIDSLVIGEPQILGQVKQAYHQAYQQQTIYTTLDKLFQRVFHVAKRVRTETQIGSNTASVAYAACLVTRELFTQSEDLTVLLVGAGETIELISRYLKQHHFGKILVANRTREKALKLAMNINAEIIALPDIAKRLKEADIIISSTASPLPIIGKGLVERSLAARNQKAMLFIDLAVPRDVEAEVADLANVSTYTIDDLHGIVNANLEQRLIAANEAEHIIQAEAALFMDWLRSRLAVDLIKIYRQQAEVIKNDLVVKAISAIKHGAEVDQVITLLTHRLTNRLLHAPTQSLLTAATNDNDYLKILSESLGLKAP